MHVKLVALPVPIILRVRPEHLDGMPMEAIVDCAIAHAQTVLGLVICNAVNVIVATISRTELPFVTRIEHLGSHKTVPITSVLVLVDLILNSNLTGLTRSILQAVYRYKWG